METDIVARLNFITALRDKWPTKTVTAQVKLDSDDVQHPFGRWSLNARLWSPPDHKGNAIATVQLLSPDAPVDELRKGALFGLYLGSTRVANVEILVAHERRNSGSEDRDFLIDHTGGVRKAAA